MAFSWIILTLGIKEASQSFKKKHELCLTSSFESYLQKTHKFLIKPSSYFRNGTKVLPMNSSIIELM